MPYKKVSQETVMKKRATWFLTHSKDVAQRYSRAGKGKSRTIYQLPNGVYAIRRIKGVPTN